MTTLNVYLTPASSLQGCDLYATEHDRLAARDAAWDAAGDALKTTTAALQVSAIDLVKRMCEVPA